MENLIEEKKLVKLFLDDERFPRDCITYMYNRIGSKNSIYRENDWVIVRNYKEFMKFLYTNGIPDIVSFDHDLADIHYKIDFDAWKDNSSEQLGVEETGYDCAKELVKMCVYQGKDFPSYMIHSMNSVGSENIRTYIENYKKHFN